MLQLPAHGREALEVLDRLLAPCLTSRPKRRPNDLLEQRGLAVRRAPEDAEVSPRHPEPGKLGGRPDDLEIGLVVGEPAVAALRLHDPELLELAEEGLRHARVVEELLRGQGRDRSLDGAGPPTRGGLAAATRAREVPACELLPDHPQRQELVSLHAEDGPQALDIGLAVEAVAALRPARGEQLLVLEIADLGDRD